MALQQSLTHMHRHSGSASAVTPNRPLRPSVQFPTAPHRQAAEISRDFFGAHTQTDTVLVVNSSARGQAVPGSALDLAVLIKPAQKPCYFPPVSGLDRSGRRSWERGFHKMETGGPNRPTTESRT